MIRILIPALFFMVASSAFSAGPGAAESSRAQSGYSHEEVVLTIVVSPGESRRVWLNAKHSYPLTLAERDKLLKYVQSAAGKIDVAVANETTISYHQEVGRFYTEDGAFVSVSFETAGFQLSYAVVRILNRGDNEILVLNRQDARDFIKMTRNKSGLVDDYLRQATLFSENASSAPSTAAP